MNLTHRPRRNRRNSNIRDIVAENKIHLDHLIYPVFIEAGKNSREEITTLPGICRTSVDILLKELDLLVPKGLKGVALFPKIEESLKDSQGSEALNPAGLVPSAIRQIKKNFPELVIFSDIALDPFSADGHDGLVKDGKILNDESVKVLAEMALIHANSGVDYVACSDMMDGRISAIRKAFEQQGFQYTGILSYAAKYASAFYGPFRNALDSAPKAGDKKTYQMDYRNSNEALLEIHLDLQEGADMIMIKPAWSYLDIIQRAKKKFLCPLAAYNVSGEYSLIKFGAQKGLFNEQAARNEMLSSIFRAGADIVFSYFTKELLLESKA